MGDCSELAPDDQQCEPGADKGKPEGGHDPPVLGDGPARDLAEYEAAEDAD